MGNNLFQVIQKPDTRSGTGARNGSSDARIGQITQLLSGDDLRGLSGGAATEENQSEVLVLSLERLYKILPNEGRDQLLARLKEGPWKDCIRSDHASS
jgi:hypothetical protein